MKYSIPICIGLLSCVSFAKPALSQKIKFSNISYSAKSIKKTARRTPSQSFLRKLPNKLLTATRPVLLEKVEPRYNDLASCYLGGGATEWGERAIADKWTPGYCSSVLEFGGGAGSVSYVVQKHLTNKKDHVVIEPISDHSMMGGYSQLLKNKQACDMQFTAIDHVLYKGEYQELLKKVSKPFDCIVADCEGCLTGEYEKNPELFKNIEMVQVERDDGRSKKYDKLLSEELGLTLTDVGYGCGGLCYTEVWQKQN